MEEEGRLEIRKVDLHQGHEAEGEAEAREEGVAVQVPVGMIVVLGVRRMLWLGLGVLGGG